MRLAPVEVFAARVRAVAALLAARHLDALLVTQLSNVAYLTGLFASAAAAFVTRDRVTVLSDGRYADLLGSRGRECPFLEPYLLPSGSSYDATIVDVLVRSDLTRIGFEASHLTVNRHQTLMTGIERARSPVALVATESVVEQCRACKDAWEVAVIREAAQRLSDAAKCILPKALSGRTESEVAADIESEMRRSGFERPAFDTIVASGPNAARPHARAGQRRIEPGELVVLDFGGVLDGYCTDLTRTVTAGAAGRREHALIEQVIEAQAAAFAAVRSGAAPEAVDAAARTTLTRHGIGEAFTHGTGHGLGLEVHEAPRVSPARAVAPEPPLAAGMVLTLEPGAYFPGWGGVRIEDDVLVTANGAEWLTDVPRFFHDGS
jgi:Xaa-Pro aminopeptidase